MPSHTILETLSHVKNIFGSDKRNETIYEHIANKKHKFHVSDIKLIPTILKNKNSLKEDKKSSKKFRNYIGKRAKKNERNKYILIITRVDKSNRETIETVHLLRNSN